jgi:hypothetical protein
MTSKTAADRLAFEDAIKANAVSYRVHLFLGRGQFERADATTRAEALDLGRRFKEAHPKVSTQPTFYAIEASGHSTLITADQLQQEPAMNTETVAVAPSVAIAQAGEAAILAKRAKKAEAESNRRANIKAKAAAKVTPAPEAGKADTVVDLRAALTKSVEMTEKPAPAVTVLPPSAKLAKIAACKARLDGEAEANIAERESGSPVVKALAVALEKNVAEKRAAKAAATVGDYAPRAGSDAEVILRQLLSADGLTRESIESELKTLRGKDVKIAPASTAARVATRTGLKLVQDKDEKGVARFKLA